MKKISRIVLTSLCLINFSLNASSAPLKQATALFSTTVKGIQSKLKTMDLSTIKRAASVFTKENAQRAHTLLNLSLVGYAGYLFNENYPQRMIIDDYWVSAELKDQILTTQRRQAHQIFTVLGATAAGIIQATRHLPINQKNKVYSVVLTSFLDALNTKKMAT